MAKFMRGRRRFQRKNRDYTWTAVSTSLDTVVAGSQEELLVVDASDWIAHAGTDRATLYAVRGVISCRQITGAAALTSFRWVAYLRDTGESPLPDPSIVSTYVNDDILGYGIYTGSGGSSDISPMWDIHIKSRRKLTNDSIVGVIVRASGNDFTYNATLRGLVAKTG